MAFVGVLSVAIGVPPVFIIVVIRSPPDDCREDGEDRIWLSVTSLVGVECSDKFNSKLEAILTSHLRQQRTKQITFTIKNSLVLNKLAWPMCHLLNYAGSLAVSPIIKKTRLHFDQYLKYRNLY